MNEKRFVAIDEDELYYITEAWQLIYEACMIGGDNINWLNNLYEENKKLKKDIADLEMSSILDKDYIECLKEENEKLKDLQGKR